MSKKTAKKKAENTQAETAQADNQSAPKKAKGRTPFNQKPPVPASQRRKRPYKGPGNKSTFKTGKE